MRTPRPKYHTRVLLFVLVCFLLFAGLNAVAVVEPQLPPGISRFHLLYTISLNKATFLSRYNRELDNYNGSYLPQEIDRFLCDKLLNPSSDAEFGIIARFYVSKAGGREGSYICRLPGVTRNRIIEFLLASDECTPTDLRQVLILVEELYRGANQGKANFLEAGKKQPDLKRAMCLFRRWHAKYATWDDKQKHDPLAGTPYLIEAP